MALQGKAVFRTFTNVCIPICCCFILIGHWATAGLASAQDQTKSWLVSPHRDSVQIDPDTPVIISNPYGDVRLRRTADHVVQISAMIQKHPDDPDQPAIEAQTGQSLAISVDYPRKTDDIIETMPDAWRNRRVDLTVFVPTGSALTVQTTRGQLIGKGLKSDVNARSDSGDIFLRTHGSVNAHSANGDVTVWFKRGDWRFTPEIETRSGDITVRLAPDIDVFATIRTSGRITTDFSLSIEKNSACGGKIATVQIGSGKGHLQIKSAIGNVALLNAAQ